MPIATINISFESTQNKQQYGTKITCTEVRKELTSGNLNVVKTMKKSGIFGSCPLVLPCIEHHNFKGAVERVTSILQRMSSILQRVSSILQRVSSILQKCCNKSLE